jgi:hypothetical protein
MAEADATEDVATVARCLASERLVIELFDRLDAHDLERAVELYADDATFLGAQGTAAIRETMRRGMAPNAGKRTRHVIGNLRSRALSADTTQVQYTAVTYTLDGDGPYAPRSVLDQEQLHRLDADGTLRIVRHEIFGFAPPT